MSVPGMLLRGLLTYLPGWENRFSLGTGGTVSARYCYAVWMRHLILAQRNGLVQMVPRVIAELGPGSSLGIGLAGLLSGAERYFALDVVRHATHARNLEIFDELVRLFIQRAPIPTQEEFPKIQPLLEDHRFPHELLTEEVLARSLSARRVTAIQKTLRDTTGDPNDFITYTVPWDDEAVISQGSVDMIFSQAVLEHVDDLPRTYAILFRWLKPGGCMSHQIDFASHRITPAWNGHWALPDFLWKAIRGRRPYLINRQPLSVHLRLIEQSGFEIVYNDPRVQSSAIRRAQLAGNFRQLSQDDFTTSGVFLQARKP